MTSETSKPGLNLTLALDPLVVPLFFSFLQAGFDVTAEVGGSVRELLCDQFAIDGDYVTGRITTIFLDGRALDDLDHTTVRDGSRLTLSAAMPGLVGATMRRGGYYAAMRGAMTHNESGDCGGRRRGTIQMKLFNLLLGELGPGFLARGIGIATADLKTFFTRCDGAFWQGCRQMTLNGLPVPSEFLGGEALTQGETVWVTVPAASPAASLQGSE